MSGKKKTTSELNSRAIVAAAWIGGVCLVLSSLIGLIGDLLAR